MTSNFDSSKEGACILYDGLTGRVLLGTNPRKKVYNMYNMYSIFDKKPKGNTSSAAIGYLAYPNVKLKNKIPNALFYEYDRLQKTRRLPPPHGAYTTTGRLEQSVTKARYIKKIQQIKTLLAAGEIYQLNYAIRFRKGFKGDPYSLFLKLSQSNPAEYAAYLNCGDFQIISNSPERLFKAENGIIRTEPIKGTAKKGGKNALARLLASEKERAELDMITDLERNDIGRICKYGTLRVTEPRAVKKLPNLWHCYSVVEGELTLRAQLTDVMDAMFPGGSITGCPKLRAMEYIEKLEGLPRNIFTGSIGYVKGGRQATSYKLQADFSIAIRTALVQNGHIEFWAGGGIVYDSDPEKEYAECLLKAEKFLKLI